jgi:NitT/TauT family transport system substrate-binding protein
LLPHVRRRVSTIALLLSAVAALLLVSCNAPAQGPVPAAVTQAPSAAPGALPPVSAVAEPSAPPARQAVKFADVPSTALAPVYVALERGYFATEGLDLELERVTGGADAVAMLGTGQLDANAGAVSAGTFNAVHRGVPIRIVAPMSFLPRQGGATPLLVRKDLADQVRAVGDMRGRLVAINVRGATNEYLLAKALAQGGLTLDQVEVTLMPFPDMAQALTQGAVDFALPAEPFATRAVETGAAAPFVESIAPGLMNTVVFFGTRLRDERSAAGQAFVAALMRAARDLQAETAKSDEHVAILAQYTRVSESVLRASVFNAWEPDLTIRGEDLLDQQRVHMQHGRTEYTEPLPLDRLVDERFRAAALERFGASSR